jgi:hypothetical protein
MPLTSIALRTHRGGPIVVAATAAMFMASTGSGGQQKPHITIRVINAKTNQPITDEKLNVALRVDQIGSVPMPTDKNGLILVEAGDASTIRILANMYADCRSRGELYTDYSLATIRQTGIATGNLCSDVRPKAKPGELILFETTKTFIPKYPEQPLSERRLP